MTALREALELFTGQAVFDPYTRRVSVDEFVFNKAREALSAPLVVGERLIDIAGLTEAIAFDKFDGDTAAKILRILDRNRELEARLAKRNADTES